MKITNLIKLSLPTFVFNQRHAANHLSTLHAPAGLAFYLTDGYRAFHKLSLLWVCWRVVFKTHQSSTKLQWNKHHTSLSPVF